MGSPGWVGRESDYLRNGTVYEGVNDSFPFFLYRQGWGHTQSYMGMYSNRFSSVPTLIEGPTLLPLGLYIYTLEDY